jgi:hypothetical protein
MLDRRLLVFEGSGAHMNHPSAKKKGFGEDSCAAGDQESMFLAFVLANIVTTIVLAIVVAIMSFSQPGDYQASPSARYVAQFV